MAVRLSCLCAFVLLLSTYSFTQTQPAAFPGVEHWRDSLSATKIASLKDLYSTNPPAKFVPKDGKPVPDLTGEIDFWQKLVSEASDFDVQTPQAKDKNGLHIVTLAVSMKIKTPDGPRTRYVTEEQVWQPQGEQWRIVICEHSAVVKMPPALHANPNLYDTRADAKTEIEEALGNAKKEHQRVILVFGANWCYDCHVLDRAFHQADVAPLLQSFQVVHVDTGDDGKKNRDVAAEYEVPLNKGIPALAVLDPDGKVLYSQKNGEWESARSLDPDDVIAFLNKWRP